MVGLSRIKLKKMKRHREGDEEESQFQPFHDPNHPYSNLLKKAEHIRYLIHHSQLEYEDYEALHSLCYSMMKKKRSESYIAQLKDTILSHPEIVSKILNDPFQVEEGNLKTEISQFLQKIQFTKIERNEILGVDVAFPIDVYLIEFMYNDNIHVQLHFHISHQQTTDEDETHYIIKIDGKRIRSEVSDRIIKALGFKYIKIYHFLCILDKLYEVFRCKIPVEWKTAYF